MTQKLVLMFFFSLVVSKAHSVAGPPHMDLNATSREYEALIKQSVFRIVDAEDQEIEKWLKIGQRNLKWLDTVNSKRPADQKISLTSAATQSAYPVSKPSVSNFAIIKKTWTDLQTNMPQALSGVIFGSGGLSPTIPTTETEFITWLRQVDSAYQKSSRYKILKPWKEIMAASIWKDVRGYLNIKADAQINQKLNQWSQLSSAVQAQLERDLYLMCLNSNTYAGDCEDGIDLAIQKKTLVTFKNKYLPYGQANYQRYFTLINKRSDVQWTSQQPNTLTLPFTNPNESKVLNFLKTNIEDEWRWKTWGLKLNFVNTSSPTTAHVVFVAGSTPSVNGVGGSRITMDKNAPLTEYDVQWTIRHEFGHILGFPDCYHEFYDNSIQAFVSYQLDIDNLMCSRRGHLQQRHYDDLKKAYYK